MDWFIQGHGDGVGGKVHPGQQIQGPVCTIWGFVTYSKAPWWCSEGVLVPCPTTPTVP